MRMLVTRPEPAAADTAKALAKLGIEPVIAPLLVPQWFVPPLGEGPYDAIALTSANAVRGLDGIAGLSTLLSLPVFAVGDHTAEAARAAGFTDIRSADGDFADLVALLSASLVHGTVLYPRGREVSGDLGAALADTGLAVSEIVVYGMNPVASLPATVFDSLAAGEIAAVLLLSRRTTQAFVAATAALPAARRQALAVLCLSAQVAEPLHAAGYTDIHIADAPNQAAILALASSFSGRQNRS